MKFIHVADIHLDSPLHGLSSYPDAPADQLRGASRDALSELVTRAIEEEVAFIVIAGDLYDGSWRDYNTGIFFAKQMGRLKHKGIAAYVLFGNHDAESEMTKKLELPDNVHLFSSRKVQTYRIEEHKIALHGQSFKEKATLDNLATGYPSPVQGYFNIGVLHTALEGYAAHAKYAPCSLDELHAKGYHYWALGHVHEFEQWTGASTIVFPGNLQGRSVKETGRRGAVLVTIESDQPVVERVFIDVLRWETVDVDVSRCEDVPSVVREVGRALQNVLENDGRVPRAVRVSVSGRTAAHGALFGKEADLRAEVLAQIAVIGNERLWLEKVKIKTQPLATAGAGSKHSDALGELQASLNREPLTSLTT